MMNEVAEFPVWGLLPKQETGVTSFLAKYPEYDGRGITIAIFDSGVDPGAAGLQRTSEGRVKIVERYDCSGCGDVDTCTVRQLDDEGYITGLTGRKLKIPPTWNSVNNEYRVGVKNAYELYPAKLKERIETERKEKLWNPDQKAAVAEATRQLQKFEATISKKGGGSLTESETLLKEDLEARLDYINNHDKKYNDLGPVYDCVLFFNGDIWQACIDTSEEGDLGRGTLLGEYSKTHEFCMLSEADQLNISINVHDNGNVLEIVGLCSGHGTHVASIASAYFADNPEKNGVAPGAQIVSLTIGDGRLTSMETGTALIRAMIKVMELHKTNPVHIINMSYGEHANWSNTGRIGDLMNEVVNKYGVVWVASAGNHGPALCTIGTPPDISQNTVIGVGAYVSPEMMVAEYSLRQKLPGMAFTWTSRGPTIDGDMGVSVCAPGAAITSVPNYTLRSAQLLNGTSMSAPHVAGAVGILLSGLKKKSIPYSPYSVKRALENSARYVKEIEKFAQGYGLLQVENAFVHLTSYFACPARDVRFSISCGTAAKGIHVRSSVLTHPLVYTVNIEPVFKDSDDIQLESKIAFGLHMTLICREQCVQAPKFLELQNQVRSFSVKIDPSSLAPGVHTTCLDGYDASCPEKGPLFSVPITVVQPIDFKSDSLPILECKSVMFKPNSIQRHFIMVPEHATWGVLKLRCNNLGQLARFVIHCMQILTKRSCKQQEFQKVITVTSQSDAVLSFQVKGGIILELVVAKYWANLGESDIDYCLSLHGIRPDNPNITMQAVDGIYNLDVRSLRSEEILPVVTLKSSVQMLRPTDSKVSPLSDRDVIPVGRQIYELVLSYDFHLSKGADIMPNSPLLSDVLYESEFESQLWLLFDSNKQLLAAGDAYPFKYVVKLERGDFVIKLQVRHEKKELLDKLIEMPLLLNRKLSSSVSLDVYSSYSQAVLSGKKMVAVTGVKGASVPIYISPFCTDKSKLSLLQGSFLTGTITYAKDELGKKVDTYPFKFIPYEPPKKSSSKGDKDKTKMEEYLEALRDVKMTHLAKMDIPEQAGIIYEELKADYPDYLAAHNAMIQSVEPIEAKKLLPVFTESEVLEINRSMCNKIIDVANILLGAIDTQNLLINLAIKNDQRTDAAKIKSSMEKQKTALLDAYARKGIALCRLYLLDKYSNNEVNEQDSGHLEAVAVIWKEILKFFDPSDRASSTIVTYFFLWHASILGHYGRVLKFLNKLLEEKLLKEIEEKCVEVCRLIGWTHCVRYINGSLPIKYPAAYRSF